MNKSKRRRQWRRKKEKPVVNATSRPESLVRKMQCPWYSPLLICAWFLKANLVGWTSFFVCWTFTAFVAWKIQVRNRQKIKFIQLEFSKIKCRSIGGQLDCGVSTLGTFVNLDIISLKTLRKKFRAVKVARWGISSRARHSWICLK